MESRIGLEGGRYTCTKKDARCTYIRKDMEKKTEYRQEDSCNRGMNSLGLKVE